MFKSLRSAVVLGALGVALFACTAGSTGTAGTSQPVQQGQLKTVTGMTITASISAVTLGDECAAAAPSPGIQQQGDCAPVAEGSSRLAAPGCGSSYCQQSNVQIAFNAGAGTTAAIVEVVSVTLHDSASGNIVGTLTASKPQAWSGNGYTTWNQSIPPAGDLKASYNLSAPQWSTIEGNTSYSTKYKLQVTLRIDGAEITLESTNLNREPQVAT
jgi:hypothetical protein